MHPRYLEKLEINSEDLQVNCYCEDCGKEMETSTISYKNEILSIDIAKCSKCSYQTETRYENKIESLNNECASLIADVDALESTIKQMTEDYELQLYRVNHIFEALRL